MKRRLLIALALLPVAGQADDTPVGQIGKIPSEQAEFFEREVRPLLVKHCFECH